MRLKLQGFNFKVSYRKGESNPTDYTSRQPVPVDKWTKEEIRTSKELETHVHWLLNLDVPPTMSLLDICNETAKDKVYSKLRKAIQNGTVKADEELKEFHSIASELSVAEGLILKGSKIVIPPKMQKRVIKIAHEGHQGLVKTKQLLRSRNWLPKIDQQVEKYVAPCLGCQANAHTNAQEPVQSTILPSGPWENVDVDFYGPLPSGEYILAVIDEYSRYPEVDITTSTSAKATIPKLDRIFSAFGIPLELKSDNGPPFDSKAFKNYCKFMGIKRQPVTPAHPRANGLVENFNKLINKVLSISTVEQTNWKQELFKFLRNYRATPHSTTGKSPAELLFQERPFRIRLPEFSNFTKNDQEVRDRDTLQKQKAKSYADRKSYVKPTDIIVGDKVLVKNSKQGKMQPLYDPIPYLVVERKGSMITAARESPKHSITRNSSFFKKLKECSEDDHDETIHEEVVAEDDTVNDNNDVVQVDPDIQEEEVESDGDEVPSEQDSGDERVDEERVEDEQREGRPERCRQMPPYLKDYKTS